MKNLVTKLIELLGESILNSYDKNRLILEYYISNNTLNCNESELYNAYKEAQEEYILSSYVSVLMEGEESKTAKLARQLGLYHKGFGNYSKTKESEVIVRSRDGELVPVKGVSIDSELKGKLKKRLKRSEIDAEDARKRKGEPEDASKKKKSKKSDEDILSKPITNVRRMSGEKFKFYFEIGGHPSSIILTPEEYHSKVSVAKIIAMKFAKLRDKRGREGKGKMTTIPNLSMYGIKSLKSKKTKNTSDSKKTKKTDNVEKSGKSK